jgi:sporulation protein YqfC
MKQKEKRPWRALVAEAAGTARDALTLSPQLTMEGDGRLSFRRTDGVLAYAPEYIHVAARGFIYEVEGEAMVITAMSRDLLEVRGTIHAIRLIREAKS